MTTFEINKVYNCKSICDQNCVWSYKVISRTNSTVTLQDMDTNEVKTCRISKKSSEFFGCENVHPIGGKTPTLWAN